MILPAIMVVKISEGRLSRLGGHAKEAMQQTIPARNNTCLLMALQKGLVSMLPVVQIGQSIVILLTVVGLIDVLSIL